MRHTTYDIRYTRLTCFLLICAVIGAVLGMGAGHSILPYITQFMRTVLDDADQNTARTTLGVGTGDSPTFAGTTLTNAAVIGSDSAVFQPNADSTTFFQVKNAAGTVVVNIDTVNRGLGINTATPLKPLEIHQTEDHKAIIIYGFDDHSTDYAEMKINALGSFNMSSKLNAVFEAESGYIYFLSHTNLYFNIGEDDACYFRDSGSTPLITIKEATGFIGFGGEQVPETLLELTDATPYITLHNSTHENTDGGGESRWIGKREDGAGTESTAGQIEISHGGAGANDTKGMMQFSVNNGTALTDVIEIDEDLNTKIGDAGTTNYAQFAADGELTLLGTARVYACEIFESTDLSPGASGAAQTILGNYIGYSYTINDDTILTFPLDKLVGYEAGTDLTVKIRYYINEAYATANGEIQWSAAWSACPSDASEAIDAPTHTGTIDSGDINIPATAKHLKEETLGTIAGASLASGDEIGITLKRVVLDGGNNPTAEPVVTCIGVIYTKDKLGVAL